MKQKAQAEILPEEILCPHCEAELDLLPVERIDKQFTCPMCEQDVDLAEPDYAASEAGLVERFEYRKQITQLDDRQLYEILDQLEDYTLAYLQYLVEEMRERGLDLTMAICPTCDRIISAEEEACPYCEANKNGNNEPKVIPGTEAASSPLMEESGAEVSEAAKSAVQDGVMCVNHSAVQAAVRCEICNTAICNTCVFAFPGGPRVCPKCAVVNKETISPRRKHSVYWSYGLAVLASVLFVVFFVAAGTAETEEDLEMISGFFFLLLLGMSIGGTATGFNAIDKRRSNPFWVWIAPIWNLVILGLLALLVIIGNLME